MDIDDISWARNMRIFWGGMNTLIIFGLIAAGSMLELWGVGILCLLSLPGIYYIRRHTITIRDSKDK